MMRPTGKLYACRAGFVLRVTLDLARGCLRCGHVFAQRLERVAAIELLRFDDFRICTGQRAGPAGSDNLDRSPFAYLGICCASRHGAHRQGNSQLGKSGE
jgi:hypothetical protein